MAGRGANADGCVAAVADLGGARASAAGIPLSWSGDVTVPAACRGPAGPEGPEDLGEPGLLGPGLAGVPGSPGLFRELAVVSFGRLCPRLRLLAKW